MDSNPFPTYLSGTNNHPLGIEVEYAEGNFIVDKDGKKYLDFIAGIGVNNIGHRHPSVIKAINEQSEKYLHTMVYGEFVQQPQTDLALELVDLLPESLDGVYFVNTGTEAIEASLKLAKRITGRTGLMAFEGAYHGNTQGSMSVSHNEAKKNPFRPLLPGVSFIQMNNHEDLSRIDQNTAAVLLETIQGDAGIRIPEHDFMRALRNRCSEVGALLILDEIQCGMGRTGNMFAFEHFDIVPDILVLGKALGGGLPLSAFISSQENMAYLRENPALGHITTFGGNPLSCASGLASLNILKEINQSNQVEVLGQKIVQLLQHAPGVKAIRQIGLFMAIDLENEDLVNQLVLRLLNKGLITFWFLSCPSSFRLAPPLTITDQEIEQGCKLIVETLNELT